MKAIILAAGEGKRMRPHTDDRPKAMIPVAGKPLLKRTLEILQHLGITDISVVTGYHPETINYPSIKKYFNAQFDHTNMVVSLFCAEEEFNDDMVIIYGDILFSEEMLAALLADDADVAVAVDKAWRKQWEKRMENPLNDAETMKINKEGDITELGKKPKNFSEIEGQYVGLIKISKLAAAKIKSFYGSLDRQVLYNGRTFDLMHMTDFLQLIIDRLMPVKAAYIHGGWFEIDTPSDLQLAHNLPFLL
ncbi:MAG: phosphocholine cytidylyltransferase family protein [Patescibacteria group bacterium]